MTNYEKITASPEALGEFLADLPVATGPWDELFHRQFCDSCIDSCGTKNCDTPGCPHQDKRSNPTWWLIQGGKPGEVPGLSINIKAAFLIFYRAKSDFREMGDADSSLPHGRPGSF